MISLFKLSVNNSELFNTVVIIPYFTLYVKQINGDYKFVRVKILTLVDENAIVASDTFNEMKGDLMEQVKTIKLYDEVLKNGKSMNKGGEEVEQDS